MDLNELLHAHQVAVMQASAAGHAPARQDHFDKVARYAKQIRDLRNFRSRADLPLPAETNATIIYGTYAGDPRPAADSTPLVDWESDGGAIDGREPSLPPGLTLKLIPQYSVGPYVYSDLALARAEHARQHCDLAAPS